MSIKVMTWAFEQRIPANIKIVLLSLADNANDDGYCWPSQETIAYKSSVSVRNLRRLLTQLEERELITIDRRHDRSGHRASNGYYVGQFRDEEQPEPLPDNLAGGPTGQIDTSYRPTVAGQEPSLNLQGVNAGESFDEFWESWPKKVSKPAAQRAWKAATKKDKPAIILAALAERLPELVAREAQFVPNPATWLNDERWRDPIPPMPSSTSRGGTKPQRPPIDPQREWEYR